MNIFDFGSDRTDDELEQALRDTLLRRSSDITAAAPLPSSSERAVLLQKAPLLKADPAPGGRRVTLLAAAVVLLLCGASALGVNSLVHRHPGSVAPAHSTSPSPQPTPTTKQTAKAATSCPLPQSWRTAIEAGVVSVDQPINQPVSSGPDGTFLLRQRAISSGNFSHDELAIFDAQNHGTTIWQAANPKFDDVDVSPDSATSTGWVVYGLNRGEGLADIAVAAWSRASHQTIPLRTLSDAEQSANLVIDFSPVVVGNTAYWIEHKFDDSASETLVAQQLPSGSRNTVPVSRVSRLVAVGGQLFVLHDSHASPGHLFGDIETISAGPGVATVPASVASGGRMTQSDGSTLRWLTGSGAAEQLNSWNPGQAAVRQVAAPDAGTAWTAMGPFIADTFGGSGGISQLLDTRSGRLVTLPSGWVFALVTGGDLVASLGNDKSGAADIRRVNVNSLNPASC